MPQRGLAGRCRDEAKLSKRQDQHKSESCSRKHDERNNQATATVGRDKTRDATQDQAKQDHDPGDWSNLGAELDQTECRSRVGDIRELGCSRITHRRSQFRVDPFQCRLDHLWRTLDLEDKGGGIRVDEHLLETHECLREDVLERRLGNDCQRSRLD